MAGHRIVYRGDLAFGHDEMTSRRGMDVTPNVLRLNATWGALLDEDAELAAATWDGWLDVLPPARGVVPAELAVVGTPSGTGPVADEARALLAACEAGCRPSPSASTCPTARPRDASCPPEPSCGPCVPATRFAPEPPPCRRAARGP